MSEVCARIRRSGAEFPGAFVLQKLAPWCTRWVKIIGHRGASAEAPENTLAAFAAAAGLGADGVEFDVQSTVDNELVVIHDLTLDRTTNGRGAVFETRWSDIACLDAGSWFSPRFNDQRVPRLVEVLALSGLEFELELKGYGFSFLEGVLHLTDEAAAFDRIEFTSSNVLLLVRLKSLRPHARIGMFNRRPEPNASESAFEHQIVVSAETSGADIVHVYSGAITARIVERLHELGFEVHANDADSPELLRRAIDSGADRLSTCDVRSANFARTETR